MAGVNGKGTGRAAANSQIVTAQPTADAGARLWWGIRRYWWLVAASVAVVTTMAMAGPVNAPLSSQREYEVGALVVARQLTIKAEQLPRFAQAVFTAGSVADNALMEPAAFAGIEPTDLIPKHVHLEPLADTIAMRVVGVDADPAVAADLANRTAVAFVAELNEVGPGVGVFALQDIARPDAAALTSGGVDSASVPLAIGVIAGSALGLGFVILLTTLRRPVLLREEAAALAGAPVLATVLIPPGSLSSLPPPEAVGGLAALVRQLVPDGSGAGALVTAGRRLGLAELLAALVCQVLAAERSVQLVGLGVRRARIEGLVRDGELLDRPPAVAPEPGRPPVVILISARQFDVPQVLPRQSRAILVVPRGIAAANVRRAAAQFGPGDLTGVAFVSRGWWHRRSVTAPSVEAPRPEMLALEPARRAEPVRPFAYPHTTDAGAVSPSDDGRATREAGTLESSSRLVLAKLDDGSGTGIPHVRLLLEQTLAGGVFEPVAELVTGEDGTTAPVYVAAGTYRVHELASVNGRRPAGPWTFTTVPEDAALELIVELGGRPAMSPPAITEGA